ncbi:MAG: glycosyltransferase family 4 protein, partial [Candidatus Babeliales bacterium]
MLPRQKPKIAIISLRNSYNYGGVLSCLRATYKFCETYFEPTVFFLSFDPELATSIHRLKFASNSKPLSYFGMNCVEIGARWSFWEPGHYVFTQPTWEKLLQQYDYFFVVSGTCIAAHPLVLLNKKFVMWVATPYTEDREQRVKEFGEIHYIIDRLANKKMLALEKNILSSANYIFSISSYVQQKFNSILATKRTNNTWCGFPIDCSKALPLNIYKENILIAVGRFSDPRKNITMLIKAFSLIHEKNKTAKLYVVGKKPSNEKLYDFCDYPCIENIVFTGQISAADLTALYRRASAMLITSHQEGLGIVGLEALLHGTPVIATLCGGPEDFIIQGRNGYLVPIDDVQAMADKALELLSNHALLCQLSLAARDFIHAQYSLQTI